QQIPTFEILELSCKVVLENSKRSELYQKKTEETKLSQRNKTSDSTVNQIYYSFGELVYSEHVTSSNHQNSKFVPQISNFIKNWFAGSGQKCTANEAAEG
ncbi:hypothetical protein L9F63_001323, partial [Diploptera punctata]